VWGRPVGFVPDAATTALEPAVALEIEARLARWVNWRLHVLRRGTPATNGMAIRRRGDGVTAFGLGPEHAARIVRWSEAAAARQLAQGVGRVGGGEAPVDPLDILRSTAPDIDPPASLGSMTAYSASRARLPPA
jgi:hypothetical protein